MTRLNYSFVPLPCAVVDEILPRLKDTELRILLVVLRQTLGQRDRQGRVKTRDWLTHQQLCRRTGRASEAVSAAVDSLIRSGLITITNEKRDELISPSERRRVRTRLFFQGGPVIRNLMPTSTAKAKITTEDKISFSSPFRKTEVTVSLSEEAKRRIERSRKQIQERLKRL